MESEWLTRCNDLSEMRCSGALTVWGGEEGFDSHISDHFLLTTAPLIGIFTL